ncbi:pilus assembly PilX N-terminal domain-containing protein [Cellulomonas sp. RIT-PI-Y]|uniref:pilus assembly PilX N-terminal domain-containing protein n=1 Tax=Cellulomonas sp. RIT-PI-Y TaxID=3035297 RepID=UPI0021D87938|nr:pilus assembly PilX N-terminal domain-containing protein [Cellulomonas sp. RIT-PI-Y]
MGTARQRIRTDDGMGVVMVVISFAVLFALVLTTSLYVVRSMRLSAAYTDSEKALSAAESGLADFLTRASAVPGYWQEIDCDNTAMQAPVTDSGCGYDTTTEVGWSPVEAGTSADSAPAYHYQVMDWDTDNGTEASWVALRVTGRSADEYRTVEVRATRESTEQYAGYQNHWARPTSAAYCTDSAGARAYQRSSGAYGAGSPMPSILCLRTRNNWHNTNAWGNPVSQTNGGVDWKLNSWVNPVDGDFFSNDVGFINPGPTSMAGTAGATYQVDGTLSVVNPWCSDSTFGTGWESGAFSTSCGVLPTTQYIGNLPVSAVTTSAAPQLSTPHTLPYETTALASAPGCHYYGPTRVVFEPDGSMRVWSKQSQYSGLTLAVASFSGTTPTCGSPAALASDEGAHVAVPDGMVVYVDDLPADVVADNGVVNDRLDAHEIGGNATYGYLPAGDVAADALAQAEANGTVGHTEIALDTSAYASSRYRTKGNLWVEGEYQGTVTLGSVGAVLVTGDLVAAGSTDQLGLVANEVSVVDQRVALRGRASRYGDGSTWVGSYNLTKYYLYRDGVDAASGTQGSWPHQYDDDPDQIRIDAAIQVLSSGLGYQDDQVCVLATDFDSSYGWSTPRYDAAAGTSSDPYLATFPGASLTRKSDGSGGYLAEVDMSQVETTSVVVNGSLAQNYLSTTGVRNEASWIVGIQGGLRVQVNYPEGSCGMDLTVGYDDRLRSSAPPYLLRFTDVGWERGDSSEVTTPANLRS